MFNKCIISTLIVFTFFLQTALTQSNNTGLNSLQPLKSSDFRSQEHPRVFATKSDRLGLWEKIQMYEWASGLYSGIRNQIDSLIERHITDPEYIVSRLQMNWEEGKHYTDFYTQGNFVPRREGNAPYPTVRITYGRSAFNSTPPPPYHMMTSYGNGDLMRRVDGNWKLVPFTETGLGAEVTNQKILEDAYRASIVYYFTGDKKYAKFAADIVWTFIRGASYQNQLNPDRETGSNGFLSYETLGDTRRFATIPLTIDFIYDYLVNEYFDSMDFKYGRKGELWAPGHPQGKEWALDRIHIMFEKMLDNKLRRGGALIGNWNTNEHESALLYALTLDNNSTYSSGKGREYYVSQFLYGPTTRGNGAYLDVIAANLDPETGLWHEPPAGYGQGSIVQLFRLGYYYYNNGINVLKKVPVIIKAATSFPQVAFPNGYSTNWGDGNYSRMVIEHAELLYTYSEKTNDNELKEKALNLLNSADRRTFSAPYFASLFFFMGDVPSRDASIKLPIASYSKVHSIIFMRNLSSDPKNALQYNVYGFGKNAGHKQANGMAMELYGRGEVLGIDPGWGQDYWVDQHVRYNSKSASHNTVMPGGVSAEQDKPQELEIMYADPQPHPGIDPSFTASPWFQFTDTYNDFTTSSLNADQRRVMGIIRTGEESGYYIDIFRSKTRDAGDNYHDYIYHNAGTSLTLYDKSGSLLNLTQAVLDSSSGFGYTYFHDDKSIDYNDDIFGVFDLNVNGIKMKTWMPGNDGRTVYSLTAPSAPRYYINELRQVRVPTLLVRQSGEAWNRPFIAVFEPFGNGLESSVRLVRRMNNVPLSGEMVGIVVERSEGKDYILNSTDPSVMNDYEGVKFKGIYGVISQDKEGFRCMYLGTGSQIIWNSYSITSPAGKGELVKASLSLEIPSGSFTGFIYTSDREVIITFPWKNNDRAPIKKLKVFYKEGENLKPVPAQSIVKEKGSKGIFIISIEVPATIQSGIYVM